MKTMYRAMTLLLAVVLFAGRASADRLWFYQQEMADKTSGRIMQYISDVSCFWNEYWVEFDSDELLPVYSCPSEDSWRGANGKASVDPRSGFTLLAWTDDEQWLLIDYETNTGHRVGYIRVPEGLHMGGSMENLMHIPMQLVRDTYITDDPNGVQKAIAQLPKGSVVDVLGYTDAHWAYIETQLDGKTARAFMPIMNLTMPEETENTEIAALLSGAWRFVGGAELLGYGAIFDGSGSVRICDTEDLEDDSIDSLIMRRDSELLKYHVYENTLGEKRYPGCPYILEVESETHFSRYGLRLETEADEREMFSLIIAEAGGGGYERADQIEIVYE